MLDRHAAWCVCGWDYRIREAVSLFMFVISLIASSRDGEQISFCIEISSSPAKQEVQRKLRNVIFHDLFMECAQILGSWEILVTKLEWSFLRSQT